MNIDSIRERLPDTAKDIRLNLGNVSRSEHLSERQLWGTLVATALAVRCPELAAAIDAEAAEHLSEADLQLAKSVATTMAMNNVYYRFVHLLGKPEYSQLPARLRMQALGGPEEGKLDRELWALAVSAVNGCGMCVQAHEAVLAAGGVSSLQIQDAVRIAATVSAAATALTSCAASPSTN
ncbi:carboxymuconolactone decarboxylase family protein [Engelhardtia mirabilis]|uniref:Alkyl hydroperoxide reductase AhpD n=1 Tax=Engelhardtia mirabilis TaxID=2528011 RepID=A0A518BG20_9BACT|nr:Alkyl hydroperoxide reductase AhpD [Planctomycetes bacterium Pla133]QDV00244.1 Alkyl hydroperoxide reductase AhpD [Planctomycetes bacterium Pla86]